MTHKEELTRIELLLLPTQLSSKEPGSESKDDDDEFSTLEFQYGLKDGHYNEDKSGQTAVHPSQ